MFRTNEFIYKLVPGEEWLREQGHSHSGVGSRGLKGSESAGIIHQV